jgi:hypothetical protein
MKIGGPHCQTGRIEEDKNLFSISVSNHEFFSFAALNLATILTATENGLGDCCDSALRIC